MPFPRPIQRSARLVALLVAAASGRGALAAPPPPVDAKPKPAELYTLTNLVSDGEVPAPNFDAKLVNGWGIARTASSPWWVANNGTDSSTLYNGSGTPQTLMVGLPGSPTGMVAYGGSKFIVKSGAASGPSRFLWALEDGRIAGWNPAVPPPSPSTLAFVVADRSGEGAVYKGLAIGSTADGDRLYAADFENGRVDVFDGDFKLVEKKGAFVDPKMNKKFAPFGIQNIDGKIYVAYAQPDDEAEEIHRNNAGFVSAFEPDGTFIERVVSRRGLNAPWGLTRAPADFGPFSGALLVGNVGDGRISAYDFDTHRFEGQLRGQDGRFIEIEELWGIGFGNGQNAGPTNVLFFAAGPDDEEHGVFGKIEAP